jgi:hypothetical protein
VKKPVDIFFAWVISGILIAVVLCSFSTDHATVGLAGMLFWICALVGFVRARKQANRNKTDYVDVVK